MARTARKDIIGLEPARTVIERVGGIQAAVAATGVHQSRVRRWLYPRSRGGTDGLIPVEHHQALVDYARSNRKPLRPADFFVNPELAA